MNDELKDLYEKNWECLLDYVSKNKIKASNPLLIKVDKNYETASLKIMIAGQETNGWNGKLSRENERTDIDFLMNDYYAYLNDDQNYFNTNDIYGNYSKSGARLKRKVSKVIYKRKDKEDKVFRSKQFWNNANFKYFKKTLSLIPIEYKRHIAFMWNNLSKIGKYNGRGKPAKKIQKLENSCFSSIFEEELKILQPDIIIFRCGTRYIPNIFGYNSVKISKNNPVKEVSLTNFPSIFAIKAYHPRSAKKEDKITIANMIRRQFPKIVQA